MKPSDLLTLPAGTMLRNADRLVQLRGSAITRQGNIHRLAYDGQTTIQLTPKNCHHWTTFS